MSSTTLPKLNVTPAPAAPTSAAGDAPHTPSAEAAPSARNAGKRRRENFASAAPSAPAAPTEPAAKRSRPSVPSQVDVAGADRPVRPLPRSAPSSPNLAALQSPAGHVPPPLAPKPTVTVEEASNAREVASVSAPKEAVHAKAAEAAGHAAEAEPTKEEAQKRLETAYRLNLEKLHQQTKWTRKAMPMVMQSAGMGLALAGAIQNPLLLFVAPLLMVSGAMMAAPAGWALSKMLQWRVANKNPLVKHTLQTLDDNLAHQPGAAEAKAKMYAENPKLKYAEELARGQGKLFETGFKAAFIGPYKFWRKQFNDTLTMMASVASARKNKQLDAAGVDEKAAS